MTNMTEYPRSKNSSISGHFGIFLNSSRIQRHDDGPREEMRFNQEGEESTEVSNLIRHLGFPMLLILVTLISTAAFIVLKKRKLNKIVQRLVKYKASIGQGDI